MNSDIYWCRNWINVVWILVFVSWRIWSVQMTSTIVYNKKSQVRRGICCSWSLRRASKLFLEECSKYGEVIKVVIYTEQQGEDDNAEQLVKIFVEFQLSKRKWSNDRGGRISTSSPLFRSRKDGWLAQWSMVRWPNDQSRTVRASSVPSRRSLWLSKATFLL